jgi:2-polyprenyl-6-methoxyphenol hydroxylase-like FAD-dependent oxidoreductase
MSNEVPVTIVGAGPVGLAMAVALARQGVASRIVDIRNGPTDHPKARGVWARTMEIFRQLGVEEQVRQNGLPPGSDAWSVVDALDDVVGRTSPEPIGTESPAPKCIVSQDAVEEALGERAEGLSNIDLRWETEFLGAEDEPDGVRVEVRNLKTGETSSWRSDYFIGADGGAGICAKVAGAEYEKTPILRTVQNIFFEADLGHYPWAADSAGILVPSQELGEPFTFLNTNGRDRWLVGRGFDFEGEERKLEETDERLVAFVRNALGLPGLPVRIISQGLWRVTRRIADRFRNGRFLLVGDAAHRFPPTGGFGMTSGIEDIHNLAWKLAFVLRGEADEKLLDSYDVERRNRAHENATQAMKNYGRLVNMWAAANSRDRDRIQFWVKDLVNHANSKGHVLGFFYESDAVISDGTTQPSHNPRYYTPTNRPGCRFPHMWLDQADGISTLDWFDDKFVLVVGEDSAIWRAAVADAELLLGIQIDVREAPADHEEFGIVIGPRGANLVRPDGVSAWRIGWIPSEPTGELVAALETITGRRAAPA